MNPHAVHDKKYTEKILFLMQGTKSFHIYTYISKTAKCMKMLPHKKFPLYDTDRQSSIYMYIMCNACQCIRPCGQCIRPYTEHNNTRPPLCIVEARKQRLHACWHRLASCCCSGPSEHATVHTHVVACLLLLRACTISLFTTNSVVSLCGM